MNSGIPDKDYIYRGLLGHSYFPMVDSYREGTPPVFTTKDFTTEVVDEMLKTHRPENWRGGYDQIEYRVNRFSQVPRLMHIPHPLPYARLCQRISAYWDNLKHICKNPKSRLKPARNDDKSVFSPIYNELQDYNDRDFRVLATKSENFGDLMSKLKLTKGKLYRARADISLFFPSVYTHSIPWALVGRGEAKANQRNGRKWYNQLDKSQRQLKRNETQGVPIGPATSNIISELILFNVDIELWKKGYTFTHFGDDYECYCETEEKAEMFIIHLAQELQYYLLSLNVQKVIIEKLPFSYQTEWIIELKNRLPPRENRTKQSEIFNFLDYAINLQKNHPDGNVLKYAARSLTNQIDEHNVATFLQYIVSIVLYNPTVLPILCKFAKKYPQMIPDMSFDPVLRDLLKYRCSDTICWGLYFMSICGEAISDELAKAVIDTKDCMSIGMFIALNQHRDKVIDFLNNAVDPNLEYNCDQYWILIHELAQDCPTFDQYRKKTGLKFLKKKNVRFIKPIGAET